MPVVPTAHVYHRTLDPNSQDSLAKLARLIRPGSQVLDLGAGPGVLGRYLTETLGCTVDGVEYNPAAATEATPWYRRLECVDLESVALSECFADCRYDFIVCADILEHLRRPDDLLAQLAGLLAPNGQALLSVPNVAYAGLIAELLAGEFRYRPEGLLDETHLRFFTLNSLVRLLEKWGLRAVAVDTTLRDLRESEFTDRFVDALPPALVRGLLGRSEALVYQFIVAAAVASEASGTTLPPLTCPPPELRFACQLFWRVTDSGYQESESSVSWGRLGVARQPVTFALPACPTPLAALRLDLADRPGLLRLHSLTLYDSHERLLWKWDGQRDSLAEQPGRQLVFAETGSLAEGVTVLLTGGDPGLELPISATMLADVQEGGELRLELSWPMSLDYLALVQDCVPRRDAVAAQVALTAQIVELETGTAALTARNAELQAETAMLVTHNAELQQQLSVLQTQFDTQATELTGLRTALERRLPERVWGWLRRRWRV